MRRSKAATATMLLLLIVSMLAIIRVPSVTGGTGVHSDFKVTIEPQLATVSGAYPYPEVQFSVNITSMVSSGTPEPEYINETYVEVPANTEYVADSAIPNSTWSIKDETSTSLVFCTTEKTFNDNATALHELTTRIMTTGSLTMNWSITVSVYNGTDDSFLRNATVNVAWTMQVSPWIDASISPVVIKSGVTRWFDIPVANNASEASVYKIELVYPADWTFVDVTAPAGWLREHDTTNKTVTFTATGGYEMPLEGSVLIKFKMTTGTSDGNWIITCTNTAEVSTTLTLTVTVDDMPPTITIDRPAEGELTTGYSVGSGNHIWINITITDNYEATPTLYINASFTYTLESPSPSTWKAYFKNTTAIPDGTLTFYINATDVAGNIGTTGPESVEINNLAPKIVGLRVYDSSQKELPEPTPGKFYLSKDETSIYINVTVLEPHLDDINSKVYLNETVKYTITSATNSTLQGPYTIDLADDYLVIKAVTYDTASPTKHNYNATVEVIRDLDGPYEINFTEAEPISGGLTIRGLYAKDLVGVYEYQFYLNGMPFKTILETELKSTSWTAAHALNSIVVLNLTAYAGDFVNITVAARDFGLNEGQRIVIYADVVPEGEWVAVELYKGWNLISLPLIPDSALRSDVLSLVLKQGAAGVIVVYGYDNATDTWVTNPEQMTDGLGYWVYMNGYDVLIVHGRREAPPPALPTTYYLTAGWVLAGFKSVQQMNVSEYLASLEPESYFEYVYVWNGESQSWSMLGGSDSLSPGEGFWIWMYEDQYLIPPL